MILNKETVNIDICLDALVINNMLVTIKTAYLEIEVVLSNYSDTKFIIEGGFMSRFGARTSRSRSASGLRPNISI